MHSQTRNNANAETNSKQKGAIAQLVEQRTENPCVPGSIPGGTTLKAIKSRFQNEIGIFCFLAEWKRRQSPRGQYATATDYDPRDEMTKMFFATVQNKLHYAVHENTAAEVIYNRVDNEKPFVGMTNFKGNYVTKDDVKIAKNYLSEIELQRLNLLVSGFLDFAEFQALEMNPMTMKDWIEALDNQIIAHKRKVLIGKGNISHKQAVEKAEKEFEIYRKREMEQLESDFDREIKKLKDRNDGSSK